MAKKQSGADQQTHTEAVVNEFSINIATVNGSGSQTANLTLIRSIFKMGIPVSGKNIFPSNIQGLPTWYKIRVSQAGYFGRSQKTEIAVAMNPKTFLDDLDDLVSGGVFLYADHIKEPIDREDLILCPMPVKMIVKETEPPRELRDYVANMVYVGVLAYLLNIQLDTIESALEFHFKGKQGPIDFNLSVIHDAFKWAENNLEFQSPFQVHPLNLTDGCNLANGNTAGGLGTIYGGMHFVSWYPITPATSLPEAILEYAPGLRKDPETGKDTYAILQAEDELAAIGMVVGAGWAGLRAMTATSGPGLSLMSEFASLAYFVEIPIVVWVIQRVGPSTGLPTRTAQGDVNLTYYLGQGDTKHIVLIPGSVNECFEFGWKALDLSEQLQTPVFVLSDLDLGQNQWMTPPFEYPDAPIDRGKVLWEEDLEKIKDEWGRYLDLDGDNIPYRTVPGNQHPRSAYYARGTGHDDFANYSEKPEIWEKNLDRIERKIESSREILPKPEITNRPGAKYGVIAFGSTDSAVREACDYLQIEGLILDYLRVRALPVSSEVLDFIQEHERIFVIENNRDGQMHSILSLELPERASNLVSVAHIDGMPLSADWIKAAVMEEEKS
ncbi:MAG: 2-oxoacid:acceptor oxidoreductase subunit alpha [Anaerolineales bacterium]|nr:2-oxoacid:acceptor oxidoreductase subunit alpha [Anaerolineales bacterium]